MSEEYTDLEFDERARSIIAKLLRREELSVSDKYDFDTWKFNHSNDELLELITSAVKGEPFSICPFEHKECINCAHCHHCGRLWAEENFSTSKSVSVSTF